ncbi:MAG: LptF/LptG family permease [Muribaculaceae bacterium]|nr:LptF/LptG family permease [Muribaculaceae bacterium]
MIFGKRRAKDKKKESGNDEQTDVNEKKQTLSSGRGFHIPGLKLIDMFILKKFLGTYLFATILLLAIISMFDITEKLDAFLSAPLKETLFDYFLSFLPYFALQLSPLFTFITVIFFTTKLAANSEIIAILSSGISFNRLMRPYMIGAAVIAAFTFVLSNYAIPPTNVKRIAYTNKYVKNKSVTTGIDIQMMASPGVVMYIGRFENSNKTGFRFTLDKFNGKALTSRLSAQTVEYDSTRLYHWIAYDYMIRDFDGMKEKIRTGTKLDTVIPVEPRDFLISATDQETLTTPELDNFIDKQKKRGVANIKAFEIEKEKRYAATAAAFILTLIGLSLSAKKVKGGMGINIGIGLALSFSYILFSTVSSQFAISGMTTPFIAMEIPNVLYLVIGLVLYKRAMKF